MTYADETAKQLREPVWIVKMILDQCTVPACGLGTCGATGVPPYCNYTYDTCLSLTDYARGTKEYKFTFKEGWEYDDGPDGVLPLVDMLRFDAQTIDLKKHITKQGKCTIGLVDMPVGYWANPDKFNAGVPRSNVEQGGGFLQMLFQRTPNYHNRPIEVWHGYKGLPESQFVRKWAGAIQDVRDVDGGFNIIAMDEVKLVQHKFPSSGSSKCALQVPIEGDTGSEAFSNNLIYIFNGGDLEDPSTTEQDYQLMPWLNGRNTLYVKIDEEIIGYTETGTDGTGDYIKYCSRGLFGTAAIGHQALAEVKPVVCLGWDVLAVNPYWFNGGAGDPDRFVSRGLMVDEAIMACMCGYGRVNPLNIAKVDTGITTPGGWGTTTSSITLAAGEGRKFGRRGFLRIDDEILNYFRETAISPDILYFLNLTTNRGLYGTTKSSGAHTIYLLEPSFEAQTFRPNLLYRRFVEKPVEIKKLLNEVLGASGMALYTNKDGDIGCKAFAPPLLEETVPTISDEANILEGPIQRLAADKDGRFTRWNIYYVPSEGGFKAGTSPDNYLKRLFMWDLNQEQADFYGFAKAGEPLPLPWIYRDPEAWFIGGLLFQLYGRAPVKLRIQLDIKDADNGLGNWLTAVTGEVRNNLGAIIDDRPYRVEQVIINPAQEFIDIIIVAMYWEEHLFRKVCAAGAANYSGGDGQHFWICGNNGLFVFDSSQGYGYI